MDFRSKKEMICTGAERAVRPLWPVQLKTLLSFYVDNPFLTTIYNELLSLLALSLPAIFCCLLLALFAATHIHQKTGWGEGEDR